MLNVRDFIVETQLLKKALQIYRLFPRSSYFTSHLWARYVHAALDVYDRKSDSTFGLFQQERQQRMTTCHTTIWDDLAVI